MYIKDSIIESIAAPGFLVGLSGNVLRINRHGYTFLERVYQLNQIGNITEIDVDFNSNIIIPISKFIKHKKLSINIDIYPIYELSDKEKVNGYLYIINSILYNADFVRMFNAYEDVITISNGDGVIEFVNNASFPMTGENYGVGTDTHDMRNSQILNEPITLDVLKTRKAVSSRLHYRSGNVLLNRAYPIFKNNGDIEKVLILAQNIDNVAYLDEKLHVRDVNLTNNTKNDLDNLLKTYNIIADNEKMREIFETCYKVASTDAPVFIQGESGTGKEVIANFIHKNSNRSDEKFVSVNCSAIPKELFESEMFGYEKGAFTGANKAGKKGLLEIADGGTIFLDEIGELHMTMQTKLLRVIQDGKIRHIGGTEDIKINVRYISATNMTINEILDGNRFRRDLYYRLSVISVNIPNLSERKEDIPSFVAYYLNYFNKKIYKLDTMKYAYISKEKLRELVNYEWPGNVRQLRNVIEGYVILKGDDFAFEKVEVKNGSKISTFSKKGIDAKIQSMLNDGNTIYNIAKELDIAPSTIYRKINSGKLKLQ